MVFKMKCPRCGELISVNNKTAFRRLSPLPLTHIRIKINFTLQYEWVHLRSKVQRGFIDNLLHKSTFIQVVLDNINYTEPGS